MKTVLQASSQQ